MCSKECNCNNCYNNQKFSKVRDFVIKKTKEINPLAFGEKYNTLNK